MTTYQQSHFISKKENSFERMEISKQKRKHWYAIEISNMSEQPEELFNMKGEGQKRFKKNEDKICSKDDSLIDIIDGVFTFEKVNVAREKRLSIKNRKTKATNKRRKCLERIEVFHRGKKVDALKIDAETRSAHRPKAFTTLKTIDKINSDYLLACKQYEDME